MSDTTKSMKLDVYRSGQTVQLALLAGLIAKTALEMQRSPLDRHWARLVVSELRDRVKRLADAVEKSE